MDSPKTIYNLLDEKCIDEGLKQEIDRFYGQKPTGLLLQSCSTFIVGIIGLGIYFDAFVSLMTIGRVPVDQLASAAEAASDGWHAWLGVLLMIFSLVLAAMYILERRNRKIIYKLLSSLNDKQPFS